MAYLCTSAPSAADGALTAMASTFEQVGSVAGTAPRIGREHIGDDARCKCRTKAAKVRPRGGVAICFRGDAGCANPEVYEFLEAERINAVRLPANSVLQGRIAVPF